MTEQPSRTGTASARRQAGAPQAERWPHAPSFGQPGADGASPDAEDTPAAAA
jgi:hypothetical protein